jgi:nucleoside-diphosphate-sugar epimerase
MLDGKPVACVTGATGMIGNLIVRKLLARGFMVRALTRRDYFVPDVRTFKGDLSDTPGLEAFVKGADLVFHCAAELRDTSKMHVVNVIGTRNIALLVREHGIRYFCHMSSVGVVGSSQEAWVDEDTPCNPQNEYERTKLEAEAFPRTPIPGCHAVVLRPTNVVDETHLGDLRLPHSGSIGSKLKALLKGGEWSHIVHAEDVAAAAVYFAEQPQFPIPRVFNVSIDEDPLNTVAHLWTLYHAFRAGRCDGPIVPLPHFPASVPRTLRRMWRNTEGPGNSRYSSRRIRSESFQFSLGVRETVEKILRDRGLFRNAGATPSG